MSIQKWESDGDLIVANGEVIASLANDVCGPTTTDDERRWNSISALISAAPYLLDALETLVFEQYGPPNPNRVEQWDAAMEKAWAAIIKAKGETQ